MGFLELGALVLLAIVIAYVLVYAAGYLAPGHPAIVDKVIWGIAILIIFVAVFKALGGHDVAIPHF